MNTFFIMFMARSGSTWLGKALSAHPAVLYHQHAWANGKGQLLAKDRREFGSTLNRLAAYRGRKFDQSPYFAQPAQPKAMVIKDSHVAQEPWLAVEFGRLIVLVRDPRAQVNSLINHYPPAREYGIEASAIRWAQRNDLYLQIAEESPFEAMVVRYEDLIEKPREEISKVLEFMHLEWHANIGRFVRDSQATHDPHHRAINKDPKEPLNSWKRELSPWAKGVIAKWTKKSRAGRMYEL